MINIEQLKKYIDGLNQKECINFICQSARDLKRDYNRMQKASSKEYKDGFMISRANSTTNYANTYKANKSYIESREYFINATEIYDRKF